MHTAKTEELFYFFSSRLHFCSEFFSPRSQGRLRAKAIFVISFPHVQYQPSRTSLTDTLLTGRALRKLGNRSGAGGKRKEGGRRIERSYFLPLLIRSMAQRTDGPDRPGDMTSDAIFCLSRVSEIDLIGMSVTTQWCRLQYPPLPPSSLLVSPDSAADNSRRRCSYVSIRMEFLYFLCEYKILPGQCRLRGTKKLGKKGFI